MIADRHPKIEAFVDDLLAHLVETPGFGVDPGQTLDALERRPAPHRQGVVVGRESPFDRHRAIPGRACQPFELRRIETDVVQDVSGVSAHDRRVAQHAPHPGERGPDRSGRPPVVRPQVGLEPA